MPRFVALHRNDDRPAFCILVREPLEMPVQVLDDLALGLGEKSEIPAIAAKPGSCADQIRARIPQRIEETTPPAELCNPLLGPREVLDFLFGAARERRLDLRIARGQRLPLIERLRVRSCASPRA